ncbi:ABC transporter substrate-binding protein [Lederbergia panacisoli]|uniref:ABC transporter substrate-binding protein n=1 Tax=Lederbergia panacisoli TaxID=1255251 RepID=UPI00214BD9ED|nr:sugar ABC transporter substrate-binding protein [Lederbergia panacisoli]MCR2821195.1 sugar ABC transporter substrate-binding protein [Lederbergia panacisoli]
MFRKTLFMIVTAVLFLGVLVGCSNSNKPSNVDKNDDEIIELTFNWWGEQIRHERTQKVIELFEEQNPNIKIKSEISGWDGYWEKLATRAAGKSLPDLIQMSYAYLAEYAERNLLTDLTPYVENGTIHFDDVDPLYTDPGKIGDQLYAVNLGANAFAIVYDPALFDEAGIPELEPGYTYEDLRDISRKMQNHFGDGFYGMKTFSHIDAFKHYLRQHDLWLFNEENDGLGYDDDSILTEFFQYWLDNIKDGLSTNPDADSAVQGVEDELIVHKKTALMGTNSNALISLMGAAERPLKLMIYPTYPGAVDGHFITPSQYVAVTAHSKHPEEAAKFIDFLTNNLEANEILAAERGVPISSKVREHLLPSLDEATKETFNYLELVQQYSRPVNIVAPPGEGEIRELFDRMSQAVAFGELTPEEAANNFGKEARAVLGK